MHQLRRLIPLTALLLAIAVGGLAPAAAVAQEATPAAGECVAPELPPGTPTPMDDMMGMEEASPAANDMAGMEASPAAEDMAGMEEMASPEAMPAGTPADQATTDRVTAAIENAVNCYNAGEYLAVAALFTPNGLMSEFGTSNPYDLPLFLEGGPPITIESIGDVQTHDDGRFSADVVSTFGNMLQHERWFLVEEGDFLLVDDSPELPVEPPAGDNVSTIEIAMVDFAFELSASTVPAAEYLVINGPNAGQYPHEIVVVRLPEGMEFSPEMAEGPPPEGVEFLGFAFAEPGDTASLVLIDVEPGVYTLLCFVDVPEGVPHVARGMIAELTVE